MFTLLQ